MNDTAPFFVTQPGDSGVVLNGSVVLTAEAGGLAPLTYQWLFNGSPIAGATNDLLTISNAQMSNEGKYSLVASNALGLAVSSNAFVNVIDLAEALGPTNLVWMNMGQLTWFPQATNTEDGFAAAVGPVAPPLVEAGLQTSVTGPGTLRFSWAATPPNSSSFLFTFTTDDGQPISLWPSYYPDWRQQTVILGPGVHVLTWKLERNSSFEMPMAFLDQVIFTPGATPVSLTSQPASQTNSAGRDVLSAWEPPGRRPSATNGSSMAWPFRAPPAPH